MFTVNVKVLFFELQWKERNLMTTLTIVTFESLEQRILRTRFLKTYVISERIKSEFGYMLQGSHVEKEPNICKINT